MRVHGVSLTSVFCSVWGVIDAVNLTQRLAYSFPTHEEQEKIAKGFYAMSGAGFKCVAGD